MVLVPGRSAITIDLQRLALQAVFLLVVLPLLLGIGARVAFERLVGSAQFGSVLLPSEIGGSLHRLRSLRTHGDARLAQRAERTAPVVANVAAQLFSLRPEGTVSAAAVMRSFGARRSTSDEFVDLHQGTLRLTASHLGESLRVNPFGVDGAPDPQAFAELAHLMRCRVTGEEVAIDPALVRLLLALGNSYRRPMMLISGHRAVDVNDTSENSQHVAGRAADIRIYGVGIEELRARALELGARGVGLYPEKGFLHVDVRPKRKHSWIYTEAEGEQPYVGPQRVHLHAEAVPALEAPAGESSQ